MKYKLMAVDIDGTLLNSNSELTAHTQETIIKAVDKGLIFTIATGRPIIGVQPLGEQLGFDMPFITYNGAMVLTGKSKRIIFNQTMNPDDARMIFNKGDELGITTVLWSNNRLYANRYDERVTEYAKISGATPEIAENKVFNEGVTKLIWYDEVERINEIKNKVYDMINPGKTSEDSSFIAHTSRPYFLEFVDRKASKAIAMEKLGKHYNIKREEMIAIGDGFNDLSMIEYAGLGIAMGNAPDEIKNKASFVTLSNDEDGLAHAIEKFILI
jgi:Cof subfamily protein (haloacid dehalogenase superfamily)